MANEMMNEKRAKVALAMIEWMNRRFCLWCDAEVNRTEDYEELLKSLGVEAEQVEEFFKIGRECWYTQELLDRLVGLLPDK